MIKLKASRILMCKKLAVICILSLFITGCVPEPRGATMLCPEDVNSSCRSDEDGGSDPTEFDSSSSSDSGDDAFGLSDEEVFYGYDEHDKGRGSFVSLGFISTFEDWIYHYRAEELWKCSRDLSEHTLVARGVYIGYFSINPAGYCIQGSVSDFEPPILYNLRNGSDINVELPYGKNVIVFKDRIYLYYNAKVEAYDLKGNFIKTIINDPVESFAIVDNMVYYLPLKDYATTDGKNSIMRYNIDNEKTEEVFSFRAKRINDSEIKYYAPIVYYNNRNIVVETSLTSFVYTNINDIEPKEIDFGNPNVWAIYVPSDGNDLHFELVHDLGGTEMWDKTRSEYCKVPQGASEPIVLKEFGYDMQYYSLYVYEGYLYYYEGFYGENNDKNILLKREKL